MMLTEVSAKPSRARAPRRPFHVGVGALGVTAALSAITLPALAAPAPYREPVLAPAPFVAVDATRPGFHLQIDFPPAANAGPERQIYWLTGAEPLAIDVQIGVGPGDGLALPEEVTGVLVIDGQQIPVRVDGGAPALVWTRTLVRSGQVLRFALAVPAARIPRGAHWASLLLWRRGGRPFPSLGFAVMKGAIAFAPAPESPGFVRRAPTGRAGLTVLRGEDDVPLLGRDTPAAPLALKLLAEREARDGLGDELGISFVAFLDGRQIALGQLGQQPRVRVPGGQRVEASFDLPLGARRSRAKPATLVVFALMADANASIEDDQRMKGALPPKAIAWSVLAARP